MTDGRADGRSEQVARGRAVRRTEELRNDHIDADTLTTGQSARPPVRPPRP